MFSFLPVSEYDATAVLIMITKNISLPFDEITYFSQGVRQNLISAVHNMTRIVMFCVCEQTRI